jgi:hypothetical protein
MWQENITPGRVTASGLREEGQAGEPAAGITFLPSRDRSNINGVVPASDNGGNTI